jgi:hypothetical protein
VDQALSPREVIEATRLIESSETARARLLSINQVSEGIQRVSRQLQDQAPDLFWPQVSAALHTLALEGNVTSLNRPLRLHWAKRAAIPIAAGILLAFLALPNLHFNTLAPVNSAASSLAAADAKATPAADDFQANPNLPAPTQELASVPASTIEARRINYSVPPDASTDLARFPVLTNASSNKPENLPPATSRLKPMFDSAPVLASANATREPGSLATQTDAVSPHKSPTSEAYLFDALNKQMPEEDISNIIGK